MSESSLSFINSSSFRNSLINKNLPPYSVNGVFSPPTGAVNYETNLTVSPVIDSPDELISDGVFAQQLYPLNEYGPEGGFNTEITYNGPPLPVEPNKGEYDPNDTILDIVNEFYIDAAYIENIYGPEGGFNQMVVIDSIQNNNKIYLPYWEPPTFRPSSYSPYEILLSDNPTGSDGTLSQDSYLARLGAQTLKKLFQDRIDAEIYQNTVGLVNLESLSDPFEASLIVTGQEPLVYKNWRITVPENPLLAAADFLTRLGGAYWPVSPIPGDYFDENTANGAQTQQTSTALNVINQLTGGFLGPILNIKRNPSQIFLANTGNGQRSALFANINYNRYQPGYDKNFGGLLGVAQGLINLAVNLINPDNGTLIGGYYVGSRNAEPSTITSPPNQIPVNPFGQQDQVPVYGPSELGILFEGNDEKINFGLKGKSYTDGGGIDGQFVWTSPKYKGNAGFKSTPGGGSGSLDEEFNIISSSYLSNESTNITFKQSSILDQTQRLIDSADNVSGIARLKHVGNAINQVSKVFNDGYKEMTKGSQVVSYTDNTTGGEAGIEYCRVFQKDTPYYTYADLQKTDGITTSGRRFTNSVFDNTYNLNIAPLRNPGSTNIIPDNDVGRGGYAKKYMFSIENLAWRTSSRPGFTYDELPTCEKGPNGGRVMWFPPYDLKFNDTSQANWSQTSFLGRPEPIYTYKDSTRTGSISWKIIVDHPSVMNTLIEKQLKGQAKERINSIIDSFFAGCVKYDIYELAKKFNTIPVKDLFTYQEILNNPRLTDEELAGINKSIPKDNDPINTTGTQNTNNNTAPNDNVDAASFKSTYEGLSFYFHNDIPDPNSNSTTSSVPYNQTFDSYIGLKPTYIDRANSTFSEDSSFCKKTGTVPGESVTYSEYCSRAKKVGEFFDSVVVSNYNKIAKDDKNFVVEAFNILKQGGTITLSMIGSASAPASVSYNQNLSKRRNDSVIKFFKEYKIGDANLAEYIDSQKFKVVLTDAKGEEISIPKSESGESFFDVNCTKNITGGTGTVNSNSQIYSVNAMACRRVRIKDIKVELPPQPTTTTTTVLPQPNPEQNVPVPKPQPTVDYIKKIKEGISKKILRNLFSECDYFEVIKESNPMVLDTIKEKIKYFNPVFHSMTPEGLNARLTFLNQCVRPGETIPTIGTDGKPKFNDAVNTSFGAPPILVLRIGDFYHTKIVPKTVSFTYEPLVFDINPEGIGIQPMIANVTLGFDFIGGHGLARPVEQLQNALSFNYYGNTEIYDERAVWTEDTSALDKQIVDAILASQTPATQNNVDTTSTNDGGSTIGEIVTNIPTPSGQTGEIGYQKIMDNLIDGTKSYFELITNKLESINSSYNYGLVQLLNSVRDFSGGTVVTGDTIPGQGVLIEIYGKPKEWEKEIDNRLAFALDDIDANNNPIIKKLGSFFNIDDDSKPIRDVKNNIKAYLENLATTYKNGVATTVQEIVVEEQNYVQIIRKINVVAQKTDGKLLETNLPRIYNLSGTTEVSDSSKQSASIPNDTYEELIYDFRTLENVTVGTGGFNKLIGDFPYHIAFGSDTYNSGDFITFKDDISSLPDKTFYLFMARILSDKNKKNEFINYVIKGDLVDWKNPVKLMNKFEKIVDDLGKTYEKEIKEEEKLFEKLKKETQFKKLTEGLDELMYPKGKARKFEYSTEPQPTDDDKKKLISDLYKTVNVDTNKSTFDGKIKFD
jgi:hypothetical protein